MNELMSCSNENQEIMGSCPSKTSDQDNSQHEQSTRTGITAGSAIDCGSSSRLFSAQQEEQSQLDLTPVPGLSDEEKELLITSWNQVERESESVGAVTFLKLFEKSPEAKGDFIIFKSVDVMDQEYNRVLRDQGLRVMSTVAKMVHRLNNEEKMVAIARDFGTRHSKYNAKPSLIDAICPHIVCAISETVGVTWSPEMEAAYNHLFSILSSHTKGALIVEQQKSSACEKRTRRESEQHVD